MSGERYFETVYELVGFLRHAPGCPTEREEEKHEQFAETACLCGLSATLDRLRDEDGVDVVRCASCGVHAATGDAVEDWAWKKLGTPPPIAYCHECAVALGA